MGGLRATDRSSGVILHPTSLPGPYGIGDLGVEAHRWIDLLADSGTSLWQILPVGPTGFGDSPYQSFSAFAGNTAIISPDLLVEDGLIDPPTQPDVPDGHVEYGTVIEWKRRVLARAFDGLVAGRAGAALAEDFERFEAEEPWVADYALFMALKAEHGGGTWQAWPRALRFREPDAMAAARRRHSRNTRQLRFSQFLFFRQWKLLRSHAAARGVRIIGDIPIFVAGDSADVWSHPELFVLDDDRRPTVVAGVPPDYFSDTGQLWGNPLYDWDRHRATGYAWWIERLRSTFRIADIVRIDHFRAFADFWEVPASATTAVDGVWRDGPGVGFFDTVRERLGDLPVIAEDLGDLSDKVPRLLERVGFPGMRVLTFAFSTDERDDFLPHRYPVETVAYTGTHDNDTTLGWWKTAPERDRASARRYLSVDEADPVAAFLEALWGSRAMYAIAPAQDLLRLDSDARMNTPGTTDGNWKWRLLPEHLAHGRIGDQLRDLNVRHRRAAGSRVS